MSRHDPPVPESSLLPARWHLVACLTPDGTLSVPHGIDSQNKSQYRHWTTYHRGSSQWHTLFRQHLAPRVCPHARCVLEIRSTRRRLMDMGNLIGGAKPIPDALITLGILIDDSPTWVDIAYIQEIGDIQTSLRWWYLPPPHGSTLPKIKQVAVRQPRQSPALKAMIDQLDRSGITPEDIPRRIQGDPKLIATLQQALRRRRL